MLRIRPSGRVILQLAISLALGLTTLYGSAKPDEPASGPESGVMTQPDSIPATPDTVLGLVITSHIDTVNSNRQALARYWGDRRGEALTETLDKMIRLEIKARIDPLADDVGAKIPILTDSADMKLHPRISRWIFLPAEVTVDKLGWQEYRPVLVFTDSKQPGQSVEQSLGEYRVVSLVQSRQSISGQIAGRVSDILARWLTEKKYKIRVVVGDFVQAGTDSLFEFLGDGLRMMVESELAQSDAFLVYSGADSTATGPIARLYANYRIDGSYIVFDSTVRADIRCRRLPSGRILMSRRIIPPTVNLNSLSGAVTLETNHMKRAMLTDHSRLAAKLAIVAGPPGRYFKSNRSHDKVMYITRLFRKNLINKMKQLVHEQKRSTKQSLLDVIDDEELLDDYMKEYHAPGEIISDLSADYLVSLKIEDMGQRLRVSSTLHSYVSDPPAIAEFIYAGDENKARFKDLIDRTLFHLARELCRRGLFEDTAVCSATYDTLKQHGTDLEVLAFEKKAMARLDKATESVRVLDIRANKAVGFRTGGIRHSDAALYLGRRSSEYIELFYCIRLPHHRKMRSWMDAEIEAAVGLDFGGGNLFRHGVTSMNLFTEARLVITWLEYWELPITLAFGGGFGVGGISMKYSANEAPLAQPSGVEDAEVRIQGALSGRVEFPVVDWLRVQVLMRYQHQLTGSTITSFENLVFDESVRDPVRGKLHSMFTLAGIKIVLK